MTDIKDFLLFVVLLSIISFFLAGDPDLLDVLVEIRDKWIAEQME